MRYDNLDNFVNIRGISEDDYYFISSIVNEFLILLSKNIWEAIQRGLFIEINEFENQRMDPKESSKLSDYFVKDL